MKTASRLALASAIALAFTSATHAAPVPNALRFSVFVSQSGQPFNGTIDIELQFFDAPSGGASTVSPLVIQDIVVNGGVGTFVGDFGAINPIRNEDTYIGGGIRLGSSLGAFQTFSSRGRFFPGGFALHAQKIAPGIVGTAEIQPGEVQRRVGSGCAFAEAIRVVNQDGSVECEPVSGSGSGGSITSLNPGAGLAGGGSTGAVTLSVAPFGIGSGLLADGAVTTIKLAGASVDASKLGSASVGTAALVDASVTSAKLALGSVGASALADTSVGSSKLGDASVTAAKLGAGSVGAAAIDSSAVQRRVGGTCVVGAAVRQINADGSVVCETLPGGAADVWQLAGNPVSAGQFLGTTNAFPLEFRADNDRALRLQSLDDPDGNVYGGPVQTINVVAGASANQATAPGATVGGGGNVQVGNSAHGRYSTVPGGLQNFANGDFSVAMGHTSVAGGDYSIAGGRRATIRTDFQAGDTDGDAGTFAWADAQNDALVSTGNNQFLVRAQGGMWLGTNSTVNIPAGQFIATSTGAHLTTGGSWTNASSRTLKQGFATIDTGAVLNALIDLPIQSWSYIGSVEGVHLGPVAEDFKAAFDLGGDGRSIATVDADGVALAAIQGLNAKLEFERDALRLELDALRSEVDALRENRDASEPKR